MISELVRRIDDECIARRVAVPRTIHESGYRSADRSKQRNGRELQGVAERGGSAESCRGKGVGAARQEDEGGGAERNGEVGQSVRTIKKKFRSRIPFPNPGSTKGPSWGYLKVKVSETLSIFGDKRPRYGSKNGEMAPRTGTGCPHIGPFVARRVPNAGKSRLWATNPRRERNRRYALTYFEAAKVR